MNKQFSNSSDFNMLNRNFNEARDASKLNSTFNETQGTFKNVAMRGTVNPIISSLTGKPIDADNFISRNSCIN